MESDSVKRQYNYKGGGESRLHRAVCVYN